MIRMSSARRQLILLAMLAFPASAGAAPYGTLPFTRVPDGTACASPTGAAGEILRWTEGGVELLTAAADGLHGTDGVALGNLSGCPRVAAQPGGAAVAAGATARELRVALREPGAGSFAAPVRVAATEKVFALDVAVSARGDAVVAWAERTSSPARVRIRVARRSAGGGFGAPEDIVPWRAYSAYGDVQVGMAADGETLVVSREPKGARSPAMARFGRPGAPLGAPQRLALGGLLSMAPDGRALVVKANGGGVTVLERSPGSVGFTAPQVLNDTGGPIDPAVAFGADGRAVVAWHEPYDGTVGAAVREPGATGFGAPVVVVPAPRNGGGFGFALTDGGPEELPNLQAVIASDGRVRLAWPHKAGGVATATIAGATVVERQVVGGRLRGAAGVSLVTLADGRGALAWDDDDDQDDDSPARQHYAVEGAADAPPPAAPRITVGTPRRSALRPADPLVLPIRCSAACDLSVTVPNRSPFAVTRALTRAGTVNVELRPFGRALTAARGTTPVLIRSSAPGSRTVASKTAQLRLRRLPAPPVPRVVDVRTRRLSGGRLEVRWRATFSAENATFVVFATRTRSDELDEIPAIDAAVGRRGRNYRVVLQDAADKRWLGIRYVPYVGRPTPIVRVRLT
ncbi:hypothetical protein OJ998_27850 [Solirubrobacter taibaiensis]|nr:hypothetical protein [Solirubrobacter taibaiensis]